MDKLILDPLNVATRQFNSLFVNKEPWQVATMTATTVLAAIWMWEFVNQDESMCQLVIGFPFRNCISRIFVRFQVFYHEPRNVSFI